MQKPTAAATTEAQSLDIRHGFPAELLDVPARDLWRHLSGPTLFRLPGRQPQPLFVSVLLHGNEETGWQAIQRVLKAHTAKPLPRAMLLFVGNIDAAKAVVRTLPHQTDHNRVWPGTPHTGAPEARIMQQVTDIARASKPFASIDIHNNTGFNPHYACLNSLAEPHLHLAQLFSRTVVYFLRPRGVQSAALTEICPSVTVECGRIGTRDGVAHAAEFVEAALSLSHFPEHPVPEGDIDILQTFAIIRVPPDATLSFDGADADFCFRPDIDSLNFSELPAGTSFGKLGRGTSHRLNVVPGTMEDNADDLSAALIAYDAGAITLKAPAIPSMLTTDSNAVRLDCLGYLMHRIGRDGVPLPNNDG